MTPRQSSPTAVAYPALGVCPGGDAGTRLQGSLREAGFREIDEGIRDFWWNGEQVAVQAACAADVIASALDALARLPGADADQLRAGVDDLRALPVRPDAGLGWVVHKSTGLR